MIGAVSQLKSDFPEIEAIDQWFGAGLNLSVDKLLSCSDDEDCYIKFVMISVWESQIFLLEMNNQILF